MTEPLIFVSYSHKDERQKDRLLSHLGILQRERLVDVWSDDRIHAGADWQQEITIAITQAKVAILLVSANFLTSEFILREEVPALLKRRQSEGLTVFPVIAKACAWQEVKWLSSMNVRPKNGRPIWGSNHNVDDDLATITKEVASIVKTDPSVTSIIGKVSGKSESDTNSRISGEEKPVEASLIGAPPISEEAEIEMLTEIASKYPLLSICLQEKGVPVAVSQAIPSSNIPKEQLATFWLLLAKHTEGWNRYGVASTALKLIDELNVGYETIIYCLTDDILNDDQKDSLGSDMKDVKSENAVIWCYKQLTQTIRLDARYHYFLFNHIDLIFDKCYHEMLAYLLYPDRGPGNYNIDSIFEVSKYSDSPQPFITRWWEWIRDGWFDGELSGREEEYETAEILYLIFNEIITENIKKLMPMVFDTLGRVLSLFKSHESKTISIGLYHLVAMLEAKFLYSGKVLDEIIGRIHLTDLSAKQRQLFHKLEKAFQILDELQTKPDKGLDERFQDLMNNISKTDKVTGFWDREIA
jgi:hypothetical protein